MKVTEVYTVEYSVKQKAWHIDTLSGSIKKNRELCQRGEYNGFVIIHVCNSHDEAQAFIYGETTAHAIAIAIRKELI